MKKILIFFSLFFLLAGKSLAAQSIQINHADQAFYTSNTSSLSNSDFTVNYWVKSPGTGVAISEGDACSYWDWVNQYDSSSSILNLRFTGSSSDLIVNYPSDNLAHMVTLQVSGGNFLKIFIDGSLVNSQSITNSPSYQNNNFALGDFNSSCSSSAQGYYQDLSYYPSLLSGSDITSLLTTSHLSSATHFWSFDGTLSDIIGGMDLSATHESATYGQDIVNPTPTPTPTPTPAVTVGASPASSTVTVGTPFNMDVVVNDGGSAFNAAQATVAVSSNLSITGLHNPTSGACNLNYTQTPSTTNPSFAGAIFNGSSTGCKVYTLTLTPTSSGTGIVTFTNASIKSYANNSEILTGVQNGLFTINAASATPTPTPPLSQLTVTSPSETYNTPFTLSGTKDTAITTVFVNGSSTGVTYPTSTTWQAPVTLSLGNNAFTLYGSDGTNQTATQNVTVSRHTLGDINGDGVVDLTDASLFAVDWGKTSNLTYILSDMNGDGSVDLTDLSILAKLEQ